MMGALLLLFWAQAGGHPCQRCHAAIVASYQKTAMARTSGRVTAPAHRPAPAFVDLTTQTTFEVTPQFELRYRKGEDLAGARQLEWFIGSGRVGHSYLFRSGNRLFQAPISWYTQAAHWQLSPGFDRRPALDLTRVVEPSCLNCHTTSFNATTLAITPGIGCERCHGDAAAHLRTSGKAAILNPAKLAPAERDSVCAQCHLTGVARVARADAPAYQPGRKLADSSAVFIGAGEADSGGLGVTSHFEKLALAACRTATGGKLTCTTCHNPHEEPARSSEFFNGKCQSCHTQRNCTREPQGDCISCHMPKAAGRGVAHSSYTDHSLPRTSQTRESSGELRPFWPGTVTDRDRGMALAVLRRFAEAKPLLEKATDVAARIQYAQILEREGNEQAAQPVYEAVLQADPRHPTAATNLGVIRARQGQLDEAIRLWRIALAANPAQTGVRMNIAQALMRQGKRTEAMAEASQALVYDPDQPAIRRLLGRP
jgi:hypothetical protein